WGLLHSNTFLLVAYQRLPLFPELARFPFTYSEEKLLKTQQRQSSAITEIFLPSKRRDVHLRACAILGARLGQTEYLNQSDIALRDVAEWSTNADAPNAIL